MERRRKIALLVAGGIALVVKIVLAARTYGTNDVYAWERFARWAGIFGARLYDADAAFNHPPSMIHLLRLLSWLAAATGVSFNFWMRLPAILADAGTLWVLWRIFRDRFDEPGVFSTLVLVALSPALILISGFHGNTDPVVMFFVLLALWLKQRAERDEIVGGVFGLALCVKILPVILLPAFFFAGREWRNRLRFCGGLAATILVLWMPYLYLNPKGVIRQVFGYKSIYGDWGIAWAIYRLFPQAPDSIHNGFHAVGAWVLIALITGAAYAVNRREAKPSLYGLCGASMFLFLAAGNGFGVQYLAWLVPWTVALPTIAAGFFAIAGGAFLLLTYNYWSGGLPWYLADANYIGDFSPHLDYFETFAWASVIVLAWAGWRRVLGGETSSRESRRAMWGFSAASVLFIAWPAVQQLRADSRKYPVSEDERALVSVHAWEDALLADAYYRLGSNKDAIVAARTAVATDGSVIDGWNQLSRACAKEGRWEEALYAAEMAIRISPGDQMANANLQAATVRR